MIEPAAAALAAVRATGADLALLEQAYRTMEAVDHGSDAAIEAIRDRHPEQARENMAQLLSSTRAFLERELAGPVHDGVEKPRTAAR